MRLKSFTAKTMKEAMQMVRDEMGEDAIIVATREERNAVGGIMHHLTAAIDRDAQEQNYDDDGFEPATENWLYDDDSNENMVIEEVTETMLRHGVPEEILDQIITSASVLGIDEPRVALMSAIESIFKFAPLPTEPSKAPLMIVGPPAAGKTLAAAKIAAKGAMSGMDIAVITTDTERAGGKEQLKAFTDLMDIDLKFAKSATALKELMLELREFDQIIIDTAGTNPFDTESVKQLARLIGAVDVDPILVLPANSNADEAGEIAQVFATIGATRFLPTRVDVARRLGSLLAGAFHGNLAFTEVSATAKVANGLSQLNAKRLTQLLMPTPISAKIATAKKAG